uniref:restriction endonuclease subunit S n=1 Tax=Pseudomonas avellanae TaxID=46257 RepID=UPI0004627B59
FRSATTLNTFVPLAPLAEQRRIVEKIDSLFGKSRRAREHLDHIPSLVEKYKQAILDGAFRGDLTQEFCDADTPKKTEIDAWKQSLCLRLNSRFWKNSNEIPVVFNGAPARWLRCYIGDVVAHRSGVAFKSGDFSKAGTQVVRLGNLYNGIFDLSRSPVFLKNADQYGAFFGEAGDVLVAQTGTRFKRDYGHFIVLNESHRGILVNQRIACLTPTKALNPYFLKLFSHLTTFKDHFFRHETGGVNQGNVGLAGIMDAPIALPSRIEQDAIVNRLHVAFDWIDRLAADAKSARRLVDQLDQSVLAKAFRGELVPQDPTDEPASILLERSRTERAAAPKPKQGRKKVF